MRHPLLDQLAAKGEAVFAIDARDRIVFWSPQCEALLGHRADQVVGAPCYRITRGRDLHGNIHCYGNCPVMHQGRTLPDEPLRIFQMTLCDAGGEEVRTNVSTFLLASAGSSAGLIVHIIRELEAGGETRADGETGLAGIFPFPMGANEEAREDLTPRERQVLEALAAGLSTGAIAGSLGISQVTVRNHVQRLLEKLEVHTKTAAVAWAYRNGIVRG
ncbi:MAG TPA: LuxR C-terminal-related transcriptional regulator [Thermoanaerobaculia bacterium]|nr:LuxR C-terminal-related transcriptional regulator [Thermoanaerobaculia bacterium]